MLAAFKGYDTDYHLSEEAVALDNLVVPNVVRLRIRGPRLTCLEREC